MQITLSNAVCVLSCNSYQYVNNKICYNCTNPCLTCTSPTVCISCINGTYLYKNFCLTSCPVSTYKNLNNFCISCNTNCVTCSN